MFRNLKVVTSADLRGIHPAKRDRMMFLDGYERIDKGIACVWVRGEATDAEIYDALGADPKKVAEAEMLLVIGACGVSHDVISSSHFGKLLDIKGVKQNILLHRLGFRQYPYVINWSGKTTRVWIKPELLGCTPAVLRASLDATC